MRPRPTLYQPLESVCLAPVRLSTSLPFVSFQSLTTIEFCNPFVLRFIQTWLLTLCVPRSFLCVFQLSPLFSHSCALFCATTTMQLFSNQFVVHSFRRHGGVGGPFITSKVPYILSKSFVCHSYENCRGVYPFFPIWNDPEPTAFVLLCPELRGRIHHRFVRRYFPLPRVTSHESQVTSFKPFGGTETFSLSVAAHEQKSALLY